jgi:transcriptional regulator with XRE-family HTH domain
MREARTRARLTQDQFGAAFGVTKQTVSAWENGRNDPPSGVLRYLCERSGLSADYLLLGKNASTLETQLLDLYRGLTADMQHSLLVQANVLHNALHPGRSVANPFPVPSKRPN